jgi:hypothetical protein
MEDNVLEFVSSCFVSKKTLLDLTSDCEGWLK